MMNGALARQQSIYGGGQARFARGQVGLAINQAGMEAAQLHNGIQGANQEISTKIQQLLKSAVDLARYCHAEVQGTDQHAACRRFFEAYAKFKQSMQTLGKAFDQAEKVWLEDTSSKEIE